MIAISAIGTMNVSSLNSSIHSPSSLKMSGSKASKRYFLNDRAWSHMFPILPPSWTDPKSTLYGNTPLSLLRHVVDTMSWPLR